MLIYIQVRQICANKVTPFEPSPKKRSLTSLRGLPAEKGSNSDSPKAGRRVGWSEGLWDYTEGSY